MTMDVIPNCHQCFTTFFINVFCITGPVTSISIKGFTGRTCQIMPNLPVPVVRGAVVITDRSIWIMGGLLPTGRFFGDN